VFERLLFPLHKRVYRQIQEALDISENKHPGKLQEVLVNFEVSAKRDTQTPVWQPGRADEASYPSLDIFILFNPGTDYTVSQLHKSADYKVFFDHKDNTPAQFKGSHLLVAFYHNKALNTFIIPLAYLLGFNEKAVLREGSYQLYSHTILPSGNQDFINEKNADYSNLLSRQEHYQQKALVYVGITKQTWQKRYRQHCCDSGRGSNLLFHRALRGEMGKIGVIEHIVERAGLTEKQALEIEEKEVENRSLHSLFLNGLNMIPGGYAGLKFVHQYATRTGFSLNSEVTVDTIESVLVDVQRHNLNKQFQTTDIQQVNAKIARLWAENIDYRINVMTNHHKRFSFRQIQAARIWHACGWPFEKIHEYLQKLDSRKINREQLACLLRGETYASIPDVLY
jgi:hypothetical protein